MEGHRGRDHMVVGFTTTYAISAYHHWCCELESWSVTCDRLVVFSGSSDSPTNKTDCHNITEILLKVALNSINQTKPIWWEKDKRFNEEVRFRICQIGGKRVSSYISLYVWFHNFSYSPSLTNVTVPTTKVFF